MQIASYSAQKRGICMDATKDTTCYIIPEGATQEEACTWQELESACQMGRLSPDTLIYLPDKDVWEKAIYTELRRYFRAGDDAAIESEAHEDAADTLEILRTAYEEACRQSRLSPDSPQIHLNAARAALAVEDREAAGEHCQNAIALQPFDQKIAAEIKRILGPVDSRKLRLLERPAPFWEDIQQLVTFPIQSGLVWFLIPAAIIAFLALIPMLRVTAAVMCFLWAYATILQLASGSRNPLDFRQLSQRTYKEITKSLLIGAAVFAELYLPFIIIAEIFILTGISDRSNVIQLIQHNEVLLVFIWVAGVLYLPAAFAVSASSGSGWKKSLDVRNVYKAVLSMEAEYLAAIVVIFIPVTAWGIGRLFLASIPVAGIVVPAAFGLYGLIISGMVIGLLSARYRHTWTSATACKAESSGFDTQ
jgi:hypothetical protein